MARVCSAIRVRPGNIFEDLMEASTNSSPADKTRPRSGSSIGAGAVSLGLEMSVAAHRARCVFPPHMGAGQGLPGAEPAALGCGLGSLSGPTQWLGT